MSEWTEEGARRTEGPADAGGMPAKKLEPHKSFIKLVSKMQKPPDRRVFLFPYKNLH